MHVTDFGGFAGVRWLGWAPEGNWLRGLAAADKKAPAITPPGLENASERGPRAKRSHARRLASSWAWCNATRYCIEVALVVASVAASMRTVRVKARSTRLGKSMRRVTRVTPLILSADVRD